MSDLTPMAEARLKICNSCEFNIDGDCALCGCVILDKVQIIEEQCPLTPAKWSAGFTPTIAEQVNSRICKVCKKNK